MMLGMAHFEVIYKDPAAKLVTVDCDDWEVAEPWVLFQSGTTATLAVALDAVLSIRRSEGRTEDGDSGVY